ncbi:MAG: four helix bundle protein [Robiginitalea sp.]|nr:four helix bundle protein [Robiginitalea sp.]
MRREKVYNLEERTYRFARDCRLLIKLLPKTLNNLEDGKQLIKASGSVGANYIEANEKLGHKDLIMRLKISRKEVKEAHYWLRLLKDMNINQDMEVQELIEEAAEIRNILSTIINRTSSIKERS